MYWLLLIIPFLIAIVYTIIFLRRFLVKDNDNYNILLGGYKKWQIILLIGGLVFLISFLIFPVSFYEIIFNKVYVNKEYIPVKRKD